MENSPCRQILARVPRRLNNLFAVRHILIDIALWAALLFLHGFYSGVPAAIAGALGFAVFCFRAFGMMHECVHGAAWVDRRWNHVLGAIYGVFCFLPFQSWRKFHLDHHMWTGNIERDPSMGIILKFKRDGFKMDRHAAWSWTHWVPTFAFLQHALFWKAVRGRDLFSVAGSIGFLGGAAYCLGPYAMATGLVIYLYMVEIINFPHHLDMVQHEGEARFSTHEQAQFARSCLYPRWFAHSVLLNFNLHTEHHLFPAHPWHQLDQLHEEIKSRGLLLNSCRGNEWILQNRKLPIEAILQRSFAPQERKDAA